MEKGQYKIGDLVFAKDMGNSGLIGLVVSEGKKNEDGLEYDVLYRGYGGDVIPTPESDIVDIRHNHLHIAEQKSDISMYQSISKKRGIKLNPIYQELMDEQDADDNNYEKGGLVDVTGVRDGKRVTINKKGLTKEEAYEIVTDAIKSKLYYDVRTSPTMYSTGGSIPQSKNKILKTILGK